MNKHFRKFAALLTALLLVLSLAPAALALDESDIVGVWAYDDWDSWVEFEDNGHYSFYSEWGVDFDGFYEVEDDTIYACLYTGEWYYSFTLDGDTLTDDEGDTLSRGDLPASFEDTGLEDTGAVGAWYSADFDRYLLVYPGGIWILTSLDETDNIGSAYEEDGNAALYKYNDDDTEEIALTMTVSGDTATDDDGEIFARTDLPVDGWEYSVLSTGAAPAADITSSGTGSAEVWEYDDWYIWLEFEDNGHFNYYGYDGLALDGLYETDGDTISAYLYTGELFLTFTVDGDTMTDDEGDTLFPSAVPAFDATDLEDLGAVGVWYCDDYDDYLAIYPGCRWMIFMDDEEEGYGFTEVQDGQLYLLDEEYDDPDEAVLVMTFDGDTAEDEDGDVFTRANLTAEGWEYSPLATGDAASSAAAGTTLSGVWEYDEYYLWVEIDEADGLWAGYDADGEYMTGTIGTSESDGTTPLYDDDGTYDFSVVLSGDGQTLTDNEGDTLFRSSLPDGVDSALPTYDPNASAASSASVFDGVWEYDDYYLWIDIDTADGTWTEYNRSGIAAEGTLTGPDGDTMTLEASDGTSYDMTVSSDGQTMTDWEGDTLFPSVLP